MSRINNSYESEPCASSNSSSTEGISAVNIDWTLTNNYQQLREYLFPADSLGRDSPFRGFEHKSPTKTFPTYPSSLRDLADTSSVVHHNTTAPSNNNNNNNNNKSSMKSVPRSLCNMSVEKMHPNFECNTSARKTNSTECTPSGSEEFSDQDVRCKLDMDGVHGQRLRTIVEEQNDHLQSVTQFSIESDSAERSCETDDGNNTDIEQTDHNNSAARVYTLSMNENSSNAIDNPISITTYKHEPEIIKDLSFNGKLKCETISRSSAIDVLVSSEKKQQFTNTTTTDSKAKQANLEFQLQLETSREQFNERSPDLFSDDDDVNDNDNNNGNEDRANAAIAGIVIDGDAEATVTDLIGFEDKEISFEKTEKAINKRIQDLLSGVLPPPSLTYIEYDCSSMLAMYNKNYAEMPEFIDCLNAKAASTSNECTSMVPDKLNGIEWPEILEHNEYGLHFNRTQYTDSIETLYMRLAERNVGLETGSSFLSGISTHIRKKPPKKLLASPGNRLSHLARRRAIFSSANLFAQSQHSSKLGRKPCVIDTSNRKLTRKEKVITPKRRLFGNRRTPGRKTPGSLKESGRKMSENSGSKVNKPTRETSKRALFLSPTQDEPPKEPVASAEIACRIEKSKRALFSPPRRLERSISNISTISNCSLSNSSHKMSQHMEAHSSGLGRTYTDGSVMSMKRKRESYNEENMEPQRSSKIAKYQSQSTIQSLTAAHSTMLLPKSASENAMYPSQQLSASHKQKLLWAVSTSLKKKSITTGHESFNQYAAVLAKVVKRLYLETTISKSESTSATMLKLADRLVFFVMQGKSVDEIYLDEKSRAKAAKNASKRLSGYINRDEYLLHQTASSSDAFNTTVDKERPSLTNSSSKSNVGTGVLRENHDSKSAQKSSSLSFSGRNQKNLSPYNDKSRSSCNQNLQNMLLIGNASSSLHSNIMKVKRQISFDS